MSPLGFYMSNPDFSIVIPSFNQGVFLEECLRSIINSAEYAGATCQIIVVDNCSNDITSDILSKYKSYIDVSIVEPDSGQSNAINKGVAYANGRFFNWLCCDDRLSLECFSVLLDVFESDSMPSAVCGRADYIPVK